MFKKKSYVDWDEFSVKEGDAEFWENINKLVRGNLGEVMV